MPKPTDIDDYLACVREDQRAALQRLREIIRAAAPDATECISYQIPTFRLKTGMLVSFGAWKNHCALYPLSIATIREHATELTGYDTDKGTIRFSPEKPLPPALVKKLVQSRAAENARRKSARATA